MTASADLRIGRPAYARWWARLADALRARDGISEAGEQVPWRPRALAAAGIAYRSFPGLGGFRRARADSPNAAWRNASFRGYADYMQTPAFGAELDALIALAAKQTVAVMCAEAVPWRCHRSLIADALTVRGIRAEEIVSATKTQPHALTRFACVDGTTLTYPPDSG